MIFAEINNACLLCGLWLQK